MYFHGGGYVTCSIDSHQNLIASIAKAADCRALAVDYRLAPEHPHPAAVEDAVSAYRWLLASGVAPEKIALAGDSAGGGLAIATLILLRDRDLPRPGCCVALSPWLDLEGTGGTMTSNAEVDFLVSDAGLKVMRDLYLAGSDARAPLASPLHAALNDLPPVYLQVGGSETLLDDSRRFADKAVAAGSKVKVDVIPEMQHVFQIAVGNMPEADKAVAQIGSWLQSVLG